MSLPVTGLPGAPARTAPVQVIDLTDEEVAVLDPRPLGERLVVLPWFDALDAAAQEVAMVTAFRGLAARGLASGPDEDAVDRAVAGGGSSAQVPVALDPRIAEVMALRRAASRVVVVERTVRDAADTTYLYEGGEVVLGELVTPAGLHRFTGLAARELGAVVLDVVSTPEWAGGTGPDLVVPLGDEQPPAEVLAELAQAHVQSQVLVRRPDDDLDALTLAVVHAGPRALLVGRLALGAGEPLTLRRVTRDGLAAWLAGVLG
ncbi:MAG: hypothetical protein U0Q15_01380 [Kineosporiaceae bacterium]